MNEENEEDNLFFFSVSSVNFGAPFEIRYLRNLQSLELFQARRCIPELVELHAHAIHQRQVQAARPAVVVALVEVVEDAARP